MDYCHLCGWHALSGHNPVTHERNAAYVRALYGEEIPMKPSRPAPWLICFLLYAALTLGMVLWVKLGLWGAIR